MDKAKEQISRPNKYIITLANKSFTAFWQRLILLINCVALQDNNLEVSATVCVRVCACVRECDLVSVGVVDVFRGQGRHHRRFSLTLDVNGQQHRLGRETEGNKMSSICRWSCCIDFKAKITAEPLLTTTTWGLSKIKTRQLCVFFFHRQYIRKTRTGQFLHLSCIWQ